MLRIITGAFMVLHGLVFLLYFGQSRRLFELRSGMVWPGGSWAFSKLLGDKATRLLASFSCILAAVGFVAGGTAIFAGQAWWRPVIVSAAAFDRLDTFLPQKEIEKNPLFANEYNLQTVTLDSHDEHFSVNSRSVALITVEYAKGNKRYYIR